MTEKRFTHNDKDYSEILDRKKHFAYAHSEYQAEKIIDELNELIDTNRELYKENEKLKQKIEDLEFALRTELAHQRVEKRELVSDTIYTYEGKIPDMKYDKGVARMTEKRKCSNCKHFQIDGMFGMWCDKKHNWREVEWCSDWEE